uniref:Uncharacterized protein n=1 Tax=Caenorhabditis tropicalis TaxID=1561998 RepID=A0A1I7TCD1_9PELO
MKTRKKKVGNAGNDWYAFTVSDKVTIISTEGMITVPMLNMTYSTPALKLLFPSILSFLFLSPSPSISRIF